MINSVKAVAANPLLEPIVGAGIRRCGQRHVVMKAGIENSDLRYRPEQLGDDLHAFEFSAIVKRRKNGSVFDGRFDVRRDYSRLEIVRAAMDHPVPHNIDCGRPRNGLCLAAPQTLEETLDGLATRWS